MKQFTFSLLLDTIAASPGGVANPTIGSGNGRFPSAILILKDLGLIEDSDGVLRKTPDGEKLLANEMKKGEVFYNYGIINFSGDELAGISVFYKNEEGDVFHTYSCYSRGLDMLNGAYHYMDLVPKGRDEGNLPYTMAWLRRHDSYDTA